MGSISIWRFGYDSESVWRKVNRAFRGGSASRERQILFAGDAIYLAHSQQEAQNVLDQCWTPIALRPMKCSVPKMQVMVLLRIPLQCPLNGKEFHWNS